MNLIPVIDLLDGEIVQAIAGERSKYRPFQDSCFQFESLRGLVDSFMEHLHSRWIYIADLNAIQGTGDNLELIQSLAGSQTTFLLDFGFRNGSDGKNLSCRLEGLEWLPVFGTETLSSFDELSVAIQQFNGECFVSIDIRDRQVMGCPDADSDPVQFLNNVASIGAKRVILLDLDAVGTSRSKWSRWSVAGIQSTGQICVYAGGGVQSKDDFQSLGKWGFEGALVASAIHRGEFTE